jgi:hypothetical protein
VHQPATDPRHLEGVSDVVADCGGSDRAGSAWRVSNDTMNGFIHDLLVVAIVRVLSEGEAFQFKLTEV